MFISEATLRRLVHRMKDTGSVCDRPRSGRPRKTNPVTDKSLLKLALKDRMASFPQLSNQLKKNTGVAVSPRTVSRRLKEKGFLRRIALIRPLLTKIQKEKRFSFANKYRKAGMSFWSRVVFTDEKIFEASDMGTKPRVTRKRGERSSKACVRPTPKRGLKVHVWGAIMRGAMGPIRRIEGNLNATKYQDDVIFDVDGLCNFDPNHPKSARIFQQDGAPPHRAKCTLHFLKEKKVTTLPWPGNSPDFNPIEHVWSHMGRRVRSRGNPKNVDELWKWIQEGWDLTPMTLIDSLYKSLPSRVSEAIANSGGSTHY